jgi:hypothetical protein
MIARALHWPSAGVALLRPRLGWGLTRRENPEIAFERFINGDAAPFQRGQLIAELEFGVDIVIFLSPIDS